LVFIQSNRLKDGKLEDLPNKHVDTGAGLERICSVLQGKNSNYKTDLFSETISNLEKISKTKYADNEVTYNVICDHIRMLSFAIADGVLPSNEGRGYVVRRVLRRASKFVMNLDIKEPILYKLVQSVVSTMSDAYPELEDRQKHVEQTILNEEESFLLTLERGVIQFEKIVKSSSNAISGSDAFKLYDTYGFPLDLTELMADEQGMSVDKKGFDKEMQKQKDLAKSSQKFTFDRSNVKWMIDNKENHSEFVGYDAEKSKSKIVKWSNKDNQVFVVLDTTPFYAESGGQVGDSGSIENKDFSLKVVDTQKSGDFIIHICDLEKGSLSKDLNVNCRIDSSRRKDIKANHSATHLLHQALKDILGSHINQAGSLVGPNYLRFDFTHPNKLGRKDIEAIDLLVNDKIAEDIPVKTEIKTLEEAKQEGAMALFGEKYGEKVRVLTMGSFSKELCGGTHVSATGEINKFMIIQDKAIASGVRRVHALTGQHIVSYLESKMDATSRLEEASDKRELEKKNQSDMLNAIDIDKMIENQKHLNNIPFINEEVALESTDGLKKLNKKLNTKFKSGIAVFSTSINENKTISVSVSKDLIGKSLSAGYLAKCIAEKLGGGGGGKDDFAMAGTSSEFSLDQIQSVIDEIIKNELKKI
ncbi:MAG: alanine--tRNA ligase, partial [Candidatus Neomarinimicrobiota bacterium]|nr:alanine--tRNA ligase [Candidatus Neomarinimicrobiota bacterium]